MLLSMTGFGQAHHQEGGLAVAVEVRTINSRYFKLSLRADEGCGSLEPAIEALIRKQVRRGAVQVQVRVDRARSPNEYTINTQILESYRRQLESLEGELGRSPSVPLHSLLLLPGVVPDEPVGSVSAVDDWPLIRKVVDAALAELHRMRVEEGNAMAADLKANCSVVATSLDVVERRAPLVVEAYRARLEDRLNKILADFNVTLDPTDVLREVGLFADRADIAEEIVRLRSHLEQFQATMQAPQSSGRKLDFLTQEMVREVNTIGSKANDVEISRHVIEIKTAVERIREMVQNIE